MLYWIDVVRTLLLFSFLLYFILHRPLQWTRFEHVAYTANQLTGSKCLHKPCLVAASSNIAFPVHSHPIKHRGTQLLTVAIPASTLQWANFTLVEPFGSKSEHALEKCCTVAIIAI